MKISYLMLAILTCGFTCKEKFNVIQVRNNADHPIAFYVAAVGVEFKYPDTQLITNGPSALRTIPPDNSTGWQVRTSFEELFEELPADTLSIYMFHPDTLAKYDWSVVRSQYKVLRRYDLSHQDLKNSNYVVEYP